MKQRGILAGGGAAKTFWRGLLLVLLLLLFDQNQATVVNNTQSFPAIMWGEDGSKLIDCGDLAGLTGLEVNFWMLPVRLNNNFNTTAIFTFLNYIQVDYQFYQTPTQGIGNSLLLKYGGKVYNGTFAVNSPFQWINVNLRVQFSTYITLSGWVGAQNVETAPDFSVTHSTPQAFTNSSLILNNMTTDLYAMLAEIRVFELDSTNPWGLYFKFYQGVWPNGFESARQYVTGYGNTLYLDIVNASKAVAINTPGAYPVERCLYSTSIGTKDGTITNQSWMTNYQCNPCAEADCLICPSNYQSTCKVCSTSKTSVCKKDTSVCPDDYYQLYGICFRCPPGCNGCTSAKNCTGCDDGLVTFTNLTHRICKCVDGQFGTANYALDRLVCANCNQNFCQYCDGSATSCTQCFKNRNLFLYNNQCVADCKAQLVPSYTNTTDQKCYSCGSYCQDCVNSTFCNQKKCQWDWGNPSGIIAYNHNGICKTTCPDSSLANIVDQTCDDCGTNCAVCVGVTSNCTVCNLGFVLNGASCISACPAGKYPDTSNVCQTCPDQCVLCQAASQCTKCKNLGRSQPQQAFYYVNYQCVLNCPDRYYKDGSNEWDLFCRSCPSGCNTCTDENTCTICDSGQYLDYFYSGTRILCVNRCQAGYYPDNTTMKCQPCLSGCLKCDNSTHCSACKGGKVLEITAGTPACLDSCPDNTYPDANNVCQDCITGCQRCSNNHTCSTCKTNNYLLEDMHTCVANICPMGYYMSGSECKNCRPQCRSCSAALTCDSCIVGYSYKSSQCISKCGNSEREDNEECDDGGIEDGDGCDNSCKLENGYVCFPLDVSTVGPDVCFCDAKFQSASWTSFWGVIEIVFSSNVVFNTANGAKSADAMLFCSQILDASMLANGILGTDYSCFLDSSSTSSTIRINVDLDSTIGSNATNYITQVILLQNALQVKGCSASIPINYYLTNLPLDSPIVYFQSSSNGMVVPKCAPYWGLNIFTSKGFTKRNVAVVWTVISMTPDDSDLKSEIQQYLDATYTNVKFFEFNADQIERLAGITIKIKALVTNFLGISGYNDTEIIFSNSKSMMLIDLQDTYTFATAVDNTLSPRLRIPYCTSDNATAQESDLKYVTIACTLYSSDLLKKTPLTDCTIKAFNMTLGSAYFVKIVASSTKDLNLGVTKWVHIDTASPDARIAYVEGCNRLFSVDKSFDLEVMIVTNVSYANFNWYCTDASTGSPCFTTSYSYITIANTKKVTVDGGQLFSNNTYVFKVVVLDSLSQTQATATCYMYASLAEAKVLDIVIDTEANRNGFIDFNAQMAAFKVKYIGTETINKNALTFKWKFTDSSGTVFSASDMSIYQNSMGILISKLERSNTYKVEVNATYNEYQGYIKTWYETEPEMTFEFSVEPTSGEPLNTIFTFSVTSQDTVDGLYTYVFGYVNPKDGISNIPIYQMSNNRNQRSQLPVPDTKAYLTCYAQVTLPSGESKTYQQNVTLSASSITVDEFKTQVKQAVMDDLVESMSIRNKLVTLSSKMALADRSYAIKQMLKGLQKENTPLSDYYIQSSVASLLEYTSSETQSLLSDGDVVTAAAAIFQQMTIDENKDISIGQYSQFGRAATSSLYNFANSIFQLDLSSAIAASTQKEIKVMFMQGLQNVLKGSLSNSILGDNGGGFSYQGQNVYVKAIKFDQLEANYKVNASLPKSMAGTLIQNFVNMSLPTTDDNPCKGKDACQVSIIILDSPINTFISNSKDSVLRSIFVDLSIQQTEVSSPYSYIKIEDIAVTGLTNPIQMTIPLSKQFTDTSGNTTLGCGYLDPADQIFKSDGVKIQVINTRLVTCLASHLTSIGVESYTVDKQAATDDSPVAVTNTTVTLATQDKSLQQINLWGSWAVYNNFIMLGLLGAGIIWGYSRDKRDELNLRKVFLNKEKIYMQLFLEPLPNDELARIEDDDNDYEAIQQEKARRHEEKMRKLEERAAKYKGAKVDINAPVKGLFSPEEMQAKFGVKVDGPVAVAEVTATQANVEVKKKKKKKKKVVANVVNHDMFLEGGSAEETEYEGGSDEDMGGADEAAESVKQKGKKKKKKKKANTLKSNQITGGDTFKEDNNIADKSPAPGDDTFKNIGESNFGNSKQVTDLKIEDVDGNKSIKSKRSRSKSLTKKKTKKKKKVNNDFTSLPPEEDIQLNPISLTNFVKPAEQHQVEEPIQEAVPEMQQQQEEETKSKKSKKGSKRKGRGNRSSSAHRKQAEEEDGIAEDGPDTHLRPDIEAEEISPSKKREPVPLALDRQNLFKPITEYERERLAQSPEKQGSIVQEGDALSGKSKVKKKKKKGKRSKKKKVQESESEDEEDEEEEDDDDEEVDEEEAQKQKERDEEEEPSGCCQFCFWNFREGHRCLSFFSYYNSELNRPSRWVILIMSWFLFQTFSGFFMGGPEYIGSKSVRVEQFICGFMAALFCRPWILLITWFMMHPKPNKVLEIIANKIKANREIRNNNLRYWVGVGIVAITIIFCFGETFSLSGKYTGALVQDWAWSFLFSIIADFIIVDGIFMGVVTLITVNVGVAPDACGSNRDFCLKLIPPAVKDSIE